MGPDLRITSVVTGRSLEQFVHRQVERVTVSGVAARNGGRSRSAVNDLRGR
jgi:hypothetical protein